MDKPRILFISRAFPPVVGGIENQNYELSRWLPKHIPTQTVANKRGRKFLPLFAPYAIIRAIWENKNYDALLLGDGVLTPVGWMIKTLLKKPVACVVHGLDINYNSKSLGVWYEKYLVSIYQKLWPGIFFKKIDRFIAVGNETAQIGIEHGISAEKIVFIPNGIDVEKFSATFTRTELQNILKEDLSERKFILTSGRLAKRKGVAWFIRNVLPLLSENIIYIIAGDGPDKKNIAEAIQEKNLKSRVKQLGFLSDEQRNILMNTCDLFIQPNIKVAGDLEGFGISVLEAAASRIPVIAAGIEGLKDAIKDGQNGFLVESGDAEGFARKITELLNDKNFCQEFGEKARQFVIDNYNWNKIAEKYAKEIMKLISKSQLPNGNA